MANALPAPPEGLHDLSPEEQVEYIGALWDEVAARPDGLQLSDAQRTLLRERLAAYRADPTATRPWSTVRSEFEAKFGQLPVR